jgi:hypothetical protein
MFASVNLPFLALALDFIYLQLIIKNYRLRKPVISSIPVLRAELHVSAIKQSPA